MNEFIAYLLFCLFVINFIGLFYIIDIFCGEKPLFKKDPTLGYLVFIILCIPVITFCFLIATLFVLIAFIILPFERLFSISIGKKKEND